MTALVSYSTGTATVSAGGTIVTGTGTIWSGVNVRPGDIFQIGNFQSVISDVVDTGTLTIPPWGGGAQAGVAYKIWQVSPQRFAGAQAMATVNQLVAALETDGFFVFVDTTETAPDPSLGNDGQYASQPTTGKMWVKSAGAWVYLGIFKAFQLKGAWSGATAYTVGDVVTLSGSSYVCVLDHTNHTPPDTTYWQLLASKGDQGNTGSTGASYGGTSTTSLTIGTGSKVFTTQSGLAYQNGARVRASSGANTSNWMEGLATYSGTTLTINVDKTNGSGTLADWNFNVVGQPGAGDLSSANNLSDVASPATAATNLGVVRYGGTQSLTTAQKRQANENTFLGPTVQVFTSGSGTYTAPAGVKWIEVELIGGGSGGSGSGSSAGNGGAGGNTTFGTSLFVGNGAAAPAGAGGATGGSASGGYLNKSGGDGGHGSGIANEWGGLGAASPFGTGGREGQPNLSAGGSATVNSGAGGGGAGCGGTINSGGGGGAGGYCRGIINSPAATYSYAVGAGGTAGTSGTGGAVGGAGGSGVIIVKEYYGS